MSSASIGIEIDLCRANIAQTEERISVLRKELENKIQEKASFVNERISFEDQLDIHLKRKSQIEQIQGNVKLAKNIYGKLEDFFSSLQQKIDKLDHIENTLQKEKEQKEQELDDEVMKLNSLQSQLSSLQASYDNAKWEEAQEAAAASIVADINK